MTSAYDNVADDYIALFGDAVDDPATRAALDLLGDVTGLRVLDAPCGNGRVARELIRRGATSVTAVDVSVTMLDRARTTGTPDRRIRYLHGDLTSPALLAGETFDAVICNYGVNEIDDLEGALRNLHRLLIDGGRLAISILHPCFPGLPGIAPGSWPPLGGYHSEGRWDTDTTDVRAELGTLHRKVSTYLNALARNGFRIEELSEPEMPGVDPVPMFLALRCTGANEPIPE